jgi:hypothetical protein
MKMTKEHFAYIRTAICRDGFAPTLPDYKARGLSAKRYRWDMLYRAGLSKWICDNLYPYLNDEHIDTAMRSLFPD